MYFICLINYALPDKDVAAYFTKKLQLGRLNHLYKSPSKWMMKAQHLYLISQGAGGPGLGVS